MRKIFGILPLAAVIIAGCAVSEPEGMEITSPSFYASFEEHNVAETRTYVDDKLTMRWTKNDEVSIFVGNTLNQEYKYSGETGANSGSFTPISSPGFVAADPLTANYAVYPYVSTNEMDASGKMTLTLPAVQDYAVNTFGLGANTMVAATENKSDMLLQFKNLCGYFVLRLYGNETIKTITFEGNNGEKIAGKATVSAAFGSAPSVAMADDATTTITLDCGSGVKLGSTAATATEFWFCIPPTTFNKGFKITVTNTDGWYMEKSVGSSRTIIRNIKVAMPALEAKCDIEEEYIIQFADVAAKYACVEKFDTNGDGELSNWEAAAATSLDGLFNEWKGVTSFDEIKYFKNVTSIDGLFNGCSKLVSITIPTNIVNLGNSTFKDCSSLKNVVLHNEVSSLGNYFFQNCKALEKIALPDGLSSLGTKIFYECTSLSEVILPQTITVIPSFAFYNCTSLKELVIPESVTSIGEFAFTGVSMWKLELPANVSKIYNYCFSKVANIILRATSYVSIDESTFKPGMAIFVPDNMFNKYTMMSNWIDIANQIRPISSYHDKDTFVLATEGSIDLGLSVKWAACNLGANKPQGIGYFYSWGEIQPKNYQSWSNYFDSIDGSENNFRKYFIGNGGKTILDLDDDAAHCLLEGKWRMPSEEEWRELLAISYIEEMTYEGTNGFLIWVLGSNYQLFFPKAGYYGTGVHYTGLCSYWSSSLSSENSGRAYEFYILSLRPSILDSSRYLGLNIRPVCEY